MDDEAPTVEMAADQRPAAAGNQVVERLEDPPFERGARIVDPQRAAVVGIGSNQGGAVPVAGKLLNELG